MRQANKWILCAITMLAVSFGCSDADSPNSDVVDPATSDSVTGEIRGTEVSLANAEFDGELAIFEGDGWAWSPSLLIFLFLEDDQSPDGLSFVVGTSDGVSRPIPHVHYRWQDPESNEIASEVVAGDYEMRLVFGTTEAGELPGTIEFAVPDERTRVQGAFRAKIQK